jgi:hypothetical protein
VDTHTRQLSTNILNRKARVTPENLVRPDGLRRAALNGDASAISQCTLMTAVDTRSHASSSRRLWTNEFRRPIRFCMRGPWSPKGDASSHLDSG